MLFTCPHSGKEPLDILRKKNPFCDDDDDDEFIVKREFNTRELTESICKNIEPMIGQIPHMVMASHHRKNIDFNRESHVHLNSQAFWLKKNTEHITMIFH